MSESNRANISQVYPRWLQIELHLTAIANSPNYFALDIQEYLNEVGTEKIGNRTVEKKGWTRRKRRQLTPIHLAAYFLHPENYHVELTPNQLSQMRKHFNRFTSNGGRALEQFLDFRSRQSHFSETEAPWDLAKEKPVLFWRVQETAAPELSPFAMKVLTVIANSVPLERAFSSMNFIHSKLRNRLDLTRADKLQFLHMNL